MRGVPDRMLHVARYGMILGMRHIASARAWTLCALVTTALVTTALLTAAPGLLAQDSDAATEAKVVRVFLLAGQSNMQGQAVVDLDHEQYYNGGRGTLDFVMRDAEKAPRTRHLRAEDGQWVVRDDVFVCYRTAPDEMKAGPLDLGFTGYGDRHHFGPELQFGHRVGDHFDEPVLLIKTAWGGKSLHRDFRPPSAGGDVGPFYEQMVEEIRAVLEDPGALVPALEGHRPQIAGFVWFQGWNDMVDAEATSAYADNLAHLVRDVRAEFSLPALPVVVGETGNAAKQEFRDAQARGANAPEFAGTVRFVETRAFLREPEDSPNVGHGHHWFGNAESYFLLGDAFGAAMLELLGAGLRSRIEHLPLICEGRYRSHLQGLATDGEALFWGFTQDLVKTDLSGRVLARIEVRSHHGDLCCVEGLVHIAVNFGAFNEPAGAADSWVHVYDAEDLSLVRRHPVAEVVYGAGGITHHEDRFYVVGGLPEGAPDNFVYEYDEEYRFLRTHELPGGTLMGIQTATFHAGQFWFGCYGEPRTTLRCPANLGSVRSILADGSLGLLGAEPGGTREFLVGRWDAPQGQGSLDLVTIEE